MDDSVYQHSIDPLTERELQILRRLAQGMSNREIAKELFVTEGTVKWYNKQIFRKLGVHSRAKAVAQGRKAGLLEGETQQILTKSRSRRTTYLPR